MPYIGKGGNNGFGIRERYRYSASGSQTAFSGSDLNSKTLNFDSGSLLDVYLNGVLLDTADYNTSTANTVTLTSGATASDEVMIIVYDVFALSDALPKSGGTITGALVAEGGVTFNEGSNDVDFRVEGNGDANALFVEGETDHVGIGNNDPADKFHVYESSGQRVARFEANNSTSAHIAFKASNTSLMPTVGVKDEDLYFSTGDAVERARFDADSNGDLVLATGDIVFSTAGKGINLGVTSNTDSNTLSDYEEGTYTVALTASTSGTVTLKSDKQTGTYTKIGRMVTASCDARISSVSSPQGTLLISLPFAVASDGGSYLSSMVTHGITIQTSQQGDFFIKANDGSSNANVHYNTTTNLGLQAESGGLGANDEFQFNLTYFTT